MYDGKWYITHPGSSGVLGLLLLLLGVFFILISVGAFAAGWSGNYGAAGLPGMLLMIIFLSGIGVVTLLLGKWCLKTGRRLFAISRIDWVRSIIQSRTVPFVLYLRSFKDDPLAGVIVEPYNMPGVPDVTHVTTEEEILASVVRKFGMPIAVGIPGEGLPQLGFNRIYLSDEEWQKEVRDLMGRAQLVIMRAGNTRGFLSEFEWAVGRLSPERLILLLPFHAGQNKNNRSFITIFHEQGDEYTMFREEADRVLKDKQRKMPPHFLGRGVSGASLSGMILFDPDWTPRVYQFVGTSIKKALKSGMNYVRLT
jgi:hypothetical protein